jgi:hypothetical protein
MENYLSTLRQSYALLPEEIEIVDDSAKLPMISYMRHEFKTKDKKSTTISLEQREVRSNIIMHEFLSSPTTKKSLSPGEIDLFYDSAKLRMRSYMQHAYKAPIPHSDSTSSIRA